MQRSERWRERKRGKHCTEEASHAQMTVQLLIRAQCVGVPQHRNTGVGRERKKGRASPPETQGRK